MFAELQDSCVGGVRIIEVALLVDPETQSAGEMPLWGKPPGLEKCSIREKYVDAASLRVSDINGAPGIHCDPRGVAHPRVLKGKQRSAFGFKFVDKTGGRVSKEYVAQTIGSESHWLIELARAIALISPSAEEFKRRGWLRFRRRIRAVSTGNEEKYRGKRG
jgi:hypothetical protein